MFTSSQLIFSFLCFCIFMSPKGYAFRSRAFSEERSFHKPRHITGENLQSVSGKLEDLTVFKKALNNILVPRVCGTDTHRNVENYIVNYFSDLGWHVELDQFTASTPIGKLPFVNIIASHNPRAKRFLDIACHYDSKYYPGVNNFVGATDSAVPCSMMIQMAHSLHGSLQKNKQNNLSLRFIFFDGEEAFKTWSKTDSLYGANHLAKKWHSAPYPEGGPGATQLDRIDMLILLDLLGAKNPEFYSFFSETQGFYKMLANAETKLSQKKLLRGYTRRYFHRKSTDAQIEDDHLPFLHRDVPIVHLITIPFPREWHTPEDNSQIVDLQTTQNLIKILTVFVMEYLGLVE